MEQEWIGQCPQGVFQKEIKITEKDVDVKGAVTPEALARMMQDVTEAHMEAVGLGCHILKEKGLLWFIVWSSVWVEGQLALGDTCLIRTWPGEMRLGMYSRRYAFYRKDGGCCVTASSLFTMNDKNTRKMVLPEELPGRLGCIALEGQRPLPKQRMAFPTLGGETVHMASSDGIDKNDHVNNACYLDWSYQLLREGEGQEHRLKFFWVQYNKEILEGQQAVLSYSQERDALYVKGTVEEEYSFSVMFEFENRSDS